MKSPKISIIVPVYNVEEYLSKCIESVLNQTYSAFELLLIDDGSHDKSAEICKKYATQDSRIRFFHKENGGVSSARNLGIEQACGDYIYFLDADDWLDTNIFSELMEFTSDYDIIRHSFYDVFSINPLKIEKRKLKIAQNIDDYRRQVLSRQTILGVCGALFASSLFNKLKFDENISCGEDWLLLTQLIEKSRNVKIVPEAYYYYNRTNDSSCTSSFSQRKLHDNLTAMEKIVYYPNCCQEKRTAIIDILYHHIYTLLLDEDNTSINKFNDEIPDHDIDLNIAQIIISEQSIIKKIIVAFGRKEFTFRLLKYIYIKLRLLF